MDAFEDSWGQEPTYEDGEEGYAGSPDSLLRTYNDDAAIGSSGIFPNNMLVTGSSGVNMNNSLDLGTSPSAIFRLEGPSNSLRDPFSVEGVGQPTFGMAFPAPDGMLTGRSMHAFKKRGPRQDGQIGGYNSHSATGLNTPGLANVGDPSPAGSHVGADGAPGSHFSGQARPGSGTVSGMKVSGLTPDLQVLGINGPGFGSPNGMNMFSFASPFKAGVDQGVVGFSPGQYYLSNVLSGTPQSMIHPSQRSAAAICGSVVKDEPSREGEGVAMRGSLHQGPRAVLGRGLDSHRCHISTPPRHHPHLPPSPGQGLPQVSLCFLPGQRVVT